MPRPRSPYSDASDNEMDGGNDMEYARLQKAYRVMQNDRKAYTIESQDIIKKQRSEIDQLDKEKQELIKVLKLTESRSNQTTDEKNCEELGELGRKKTDVEKQIKEEKEKHQQLDAEIKEWNKKNREQNKKAGGTQTSSKSQGKTTKDTRKLENQLQLANNKFCKALQDNKKYRHEIDSLRVERKRFEDLYKKLDKERQKLKEESGEVIDQATAAHDQREDAQAKMILLKDRSEKDIQQHNTEMKELIRILDHDKKLRLFMTTKCRERQEDPQLVMWRQQREAAMAERMKASQTDSVESYEEAFQKIKEMRSEDDLDLLVKNFIQMEDTNFALFNYVNEQNNELEILKEQIEEINHDIDNFRKQGVELEQKRKELLEELDGKYSEASTKANGYDEKYKDVSKILDQLRAGVDSVFGKIGCDPDSINDMLGSQSGVTNQNMIQYLGVVEQRTNHLLLLQAYISNKQEEDHYSPRKVQLLGEGPQPQQNAPNIPAPSVGDDYDSDGSNDSDDNTRPLTRVELTTKAMKSVKKREQDMKKQEFRYDLSDAREKAKKKDKKGKY